MIISLNPSFLRGPDVQTAGMSCHFIVLGSTDPVKCCTSLGKFCNKFMFGADEMVQQVKVFAAKPGSLNWIPRTQLKEKTDSCKVSSRLHMRHIAQIPHCRPQSAVLLEGSIMSTGVFPTVPSFLHTRFHGNTPKTLQSITDTLHSRDAFSEVCILLPRQYQLILWCWCRKESPSVGLRCVSEP